LANSKIAQQNRRTRKTRKISSTRKTVRQQTAQFAEQQTAAKLAHQQTAAKFQRSGNSTGRLPAGDISPGTLTA
jgi:hypothetical protein